MSQSLAHLVPADRATLDRFGNGDPAKLRTYLLMLAAFLEGRNQNTRSAYQLAIKQFFALFNWTSPESITPAHVAAYKKWMITKKYADATTYQRISAISSFFAFLCTPHSTTGDSVLRNNPCAHIPRGDIQPTPYSQAQAMDWVTFLKLYNALPLTTMGCRDRAILLFFAFTGRRRAEVASLRIRDLDLKARPRTYTVKVKGGRVHPFELPDICYDAIRVYWIMSNRLSSLRADDGVFTPADVTRVNKGLDPRKPLSVRHMNDILTRAAVRAGMPPGGAIRIHGMRHMAARDLNEAGVRLQDIQAFLDHASPATTQIYLGRLSGPASAHTDALIRIRDEMASLARLAFKPTSGAKQG